MEDYYIRTPETDHSRGPFDVDKLHSLAEAGQVTENTLYYDEDAEEWKPIALNEALKAKIFPERKRLSLAIHKSDPNDNEDNEDEDDDNEEEATSVDVRDLLAAADGETEETSHVRKEKDSAERSAQLAPTGLGIAMLLSALFLIYPQFHLIQEAINGGSITDLVTYPFLLIGFFDLLLAIALFLAVKEVYPFVRGRAMIALGFGAYLGWALHAPELILAFLLAGIGPFVATLSKRIVLTTAALVLSLLGTGFLAFLSISGRFDGFFDAVQFNF